MRIPPTVRFYEFMGDMRFVADPRDTFSWVDAVESSGYFDVGPPVSSMAAVEYYG